MGGACDHVTYSGWGQQSCDYIGCVDDHDLNFSRMVTMATANYQRALGQGCSHAEAWNLSSIDWTIAATVSNYSTLKIKAIIKNTASIHSGSLSLCGSEGIPRVCAVGRLVS